MIRKLITPLTIVLIAFHAGAATLAGVSLPDSFPVDGQTLVLNGLGLRTLTIFNIRAYVAGLYLSRESHNAHEILASSGPKVIVMHFLHTGSKAQVEREFRVGESRNCGDGSCARSDEADFERLVASAPAVNVGDTFTYIFTDGGVRMLANDRLLGDFANRDLAYHLLAGFIGDHPPSEALRSGLLGTSAE